MTGEDDAAVAAEIAAESAILDQNASWRTQIAAGIEQLENAATTADADATNATTKQTAAQTVADAATTRAATVNASTPALTLAYVTAIKAEVVALHTRDAQIATAMAEVYGWRSLLDGGYALVCRSVAWLGRLMQRVGT